MSKREIDRVSILQQSTLFRSLDRSQLQLIATSAYERRYRRGEIVFHHEDRGDCMYIIVSGYVRIYVLSEDGREMTLRIYGAGDSFGEMSLLDHGRRSASAIAMDDITTLVIDRERFRPLMQKSFDLTEAVIAVLVERLRYTTNFSQNLAFMNVSSRIAAALVELVLRSGEQADPARVVVTQQDLASYASATREWVNKALQLFEARGLVTLRRGSITVHNRERLRRWPDVN